MISRLLFHIFCFFTYLIVISLLFYYFQSRPFFGFILIQKLYHINHWIQYCIYQTGHGKKIGRKKHSESAFSTFLNYFQIKYYHENLIITLIYINPFQTKWWSIYFICMNLSYFVRNGYLNCRWCSIMTNSRENSSTISSMSS